MREAVAAARAAEQVGLPLWVSWNLRLDAPILRGGETLAAAAAAVARLPVEGLMVNCVPTGLVRPAIEQLRAVTDRPLGAYANSCEFAPSQDDVQRKHGPARLRAPGRGRVGRVVEEYDSAPRQFE